MATAAHTQTHAPEAARAHPWKRSPSAHEALEAHYAANPGTRQQFARRHSTGQLHSE